MHALREGGVCPVCRPCVRVMPVPCAGMIREFLETARSSGRIEGSVQDAMRRMCVQSAPLRPPLRSPPPVWDIASLGPMSEPSCSHIVPRRLTNDELPLLYKAATAMVMPTRGEGWGRFVAWGLRGRSERPA